MSATAATTTAATATGPTTPNGKARSARNALSHGLTTRDLYVPAAQQQEFEALQQALRRDLYPATPAEFLLFHHIVSASWRLRRCDQAEVALAAATGADPLLDPALEPKLRTLDRTRAQASKMLHKSIAELRRLQSEQFYRLGALPAEEGYDTRYMGLTDSQSVRARLKKEETLDGKNYLLSRQVQKLAATSPSDKPSAGVLHPTLFPLVTDDEYNQAKAAYEAHQAAQAAHDDNGHDDDYDEDDNEDDNGLGDIENNPLFLEMKARCEEIAATALGGRSVSAKTQTGTPNAAARRP